MLGGRRAAARPSSRRALDGDDRRPVRPRRSDQAELCAGDRATLRSLGLTPVLLTGDNERTARAVAAEVGIDERDRRRPARREARRRRTPAGERGDGGDGRRRRQRRTRARAGRPRARDRHGHRRRDRGERPDARLGRPACRRRRDPALAPHAAHDQGQPLLGLRLQRRRDPARRRRAPEPGRRGRGDGLLERVRRHATACACGASTDSGRRSDARVRGGQGSCS